MEPTTFQWIALFGITAAVINGIGIYAIHRYREYAEKAKTYLMCFAAGILITVPLTLALPKAIGKAPRAGFVALGGFLFMYLSNQLVKKYTEGKDAAFGVTAAEGIGIHSFIDGIVYTVTFQASVLIGILAGLGMVIHEFAEGVITYLVLTKGGISKRTSILYSFLIAGLTTPIGAFIVYPLVSTIKDTTLGLMLGFASGVLLYVSSSHLLPEAREHEEEHSSIALLAGVGLALMIVLLKSS
ncbi:MAG: ZIP family metal transporter [Candidatus Nanohaloarchaeota archaeon QJJ-9]|nr:ZIP family metal transporter [Candidatus Nanohaloarchaeota archaeon QJJ-9]